MHEVSLMRDLLAQVKQVMQHNALTSLRSIHIEIGPLSGVDPLLVEQAFFRLAAEAGLANTRLVVDQTRLMALCRDCQSQFEVLDFRFSCPFCSSSKTQVISGDQLRLISISTTQPETSFEFSGTETT